jgi:hypothetical protein
VIQADLGHEALEADAPLRCGPAAALVFVDDEDAVGGPAEVYGPSSEGVLSLGGFGILTDLLWCGLAHVDDREAVEVPGLDRLAIDEVNDAV